MPRQDNGADFYLHARLFKYFIELNIEIPLILLHALNITAYRDMPRQVFQIPQLSKQMHILKVQTSP